MIYRSLLKLLIRTASPVVCFTPLLVNCSSQKSSQITEIHKLKLPDTNLLTYDYLIKQSTIKAVNDSSELLTITYTAIEVASFDYRTSLIKLIGLCKDTIGNHVDSSHWDEIVQTRTETQEKKQILIELINFMDSVRKMAESATEICLSYGMDNLCSTLSERINDAVRNIDKEVFNNQELEKEYSYVQQQCITETKDS